MNNGLVYIGRVVNVEAMNADKIERLDVDCGNGGGKWSGCAQKGQFSVGAPCQVYLPDSLLPHTPELAFMEKSHWRVRMMRLRGIASECLIMPQTITGVVGDDVTVEASVTKYEKPIPTSMGGEIAGNFPSFIPKTDEPLYQRVPDILAALVGQSYYVTLKADGSSCTAYKWQGHFGVCSRNWELKETDGNVYWQVAKRYELETKLPDGYCVQFEVVGPGIQGNSMGLKQPDMRLFNVYNITERRYLDGLDAATFSNSLGLYFVDAVNPPTETFSLDIDLRKLAEQTYENGKPAEGIVIRPMREQEVAVDGKPERLSFKVINLAYKEVE